MTSHGCLYLGAAYLSGYPAPPPRAFGNRPENVFQLKEDFNYPVVYIHNRKKIGPPSTPPPLPTPRGLGSRTELQPPPPPAWCTPTAFQPSTNVFQRPATSPPLQVSDIVARVLCAVRGAVVEDYAQEDVQGIEIHSNGSTTTP